MFTVTAIKEAHAKVKSGADFPAYVQELKAMGVAGYHHYLADGHTEYTGANDFAIRSAAAYPSLTIATESSAAVLKKALLVHQQGQTDYPTFCKEAAATGVEKWVCDFNAMTCTYLDTKGTVLVVEEIPAA